MKEIRDRNDGRIGFRVHVQPSTPEEKLLGWNKAGELRIRLHSRPIGGKANKDLVRVLAGALGVKKGDVKIESGGRSRVKIVSVPRSARETLERLPEID